MIEIPDTTEPVTITKKDYPELPFNEVYITNPKKFKERIQLYHERMVEEYFKGSFKKE